MGRKTNKPILNFTMTKFSSMSFSTRLMIVLDAILLLLEEEEEEGFKKF